MGQLPDGTCSMCHTIDNKAAHGAGTHGDTHYMPNPARAHTRTPPAAPTCIHTSCDSSQLRMVNPLPTLPTYTFPIPPPPALLPPPGLSAPPELLPSPMPSSEAESPYDPAADPLPPLPLPPWKLVAPLPVLKLGHASTWGCRLGREGSLEQQPGSCLSESATLRMSSTSTVQLSSSSSPPRSTSNRDSMADMAGGHVLWACRGTTRASFSISVLSEVTADAPLNA